MREIAPSTGLLKRFCHNPEKWEGFKEEYTKELKNEKDLLHKIRLIEAEKGIVTLLYATKNMEHNNAVVLSSILKGE